MKRTSGETPPEDAPPEETGRAGDIERARLQADVALQRVRLAKDELRRARKRLKEAKREAKRARKQAAAARKDWKRARRQAKHAGSSKNETVASPGNPRKRSRKSQGDSVTRAKKSRGKKKSARAAKAAATPR